MPSFARNEVLTRTAGEIRELMAAIEQLHEPKSGAPETSERKMFQC